MNEEIIINFRNQQGLRCSDFDMATGKVIVNDIEITSVEDWEKVTKSLVDLQQENRQLKDRINKAIEYIEKCNPDADLHSMFLSESYISNYGACELLDILKGVKDD